MIASGTRTRTLVMYMVVLGLNAPVGVAIGELSNIFKIQKRDFRSHQRNSSEVERSHLGPKLNKNKFEWLPTNYMNAAKLPTLTFSSHRA
jgi:hypothetical protein